MHSVRNVEQEVSVVLIQSLLEILKMSRVILRNHSTSDVGSYTLDNIQPLLHSINLLTGDEKDSAVSLLLAGILLLVVKRINTVIDHTQLLLKLGKVVGLLVC